MKTVTLPSILLDQTATVYSRAVGGGYTTVVTSNLPVRLANVNPKGAPTAQFRAELASLRRLLWGPNTTLAEDAQIEVSGVRYNIRAGTVQAARGPSGEVVYQTCNVVRAK